MYNCCEEYEIKVQVKIPIFVEEKRNRDIHLNGKVQMRTEKKKNKIDKIDNKILVAFDLENIITLLRIDVGWFFYKRKLTMYNLTAST